MRLRDGYTSSSDAERSRPTLPFDGDAPSGASLRSPSPSLRSCFADESEARVLLVCFAVARVEVTAWALAAALGTAVPPTIDHLRVEVADQLADEVIMRPCRARG